jgi:hypothetical protein
MTQCLNKRISKVIVPKAFFIALCFMCAFCCAQQDPKPLPAISSWASLSLGQVAKSPTTVSGMNGDLFMDKEVLSSFDAGLKTFARIGTHTVGRFHLGLSMNYNVTTNAKTSVNLMPAVDLTMRKNMINILDATLQSAWGVCGNRDTLMTELGLFPFKYNPQAQDLGEYLFRSGTYPGTLYSGFEVSDKIRLCGAHLSYTWNKFGRIRQDLFFTNELEQYPLHDFNLAYLATYSPGRPLEIGAGICFAHLLTLDERRTTPWNDTVTFPKSRRPAPTIYRWIASVDTVTYDTVPYTFRGIKTVARITLDPIWFLRSPGSLFGKEECKIYGEGAILGVKDYAVWYEHITERMPAMFGIVVPTFKLFDVLSVEAEYCASPYLNTPYFVWTQRSPIPFTSTGISDLDTWQRRDNNHWKWSVYGSRKINAKLRLSAQVASDHLSEMQYTGPVPSYVGYREVVPRTQDWYYMLRAMIYF